jgi:hypothetical protein
MLPTMRSVLHQQLPTATYHPIVNDFASRITANGGTISSADLAAHNTFVQTLESSGFIESGLTSGATSSGSYIREIYTIAGNNLNAALVKLLYRSGGSSTLSHTGFSSGAYTRSGGITADGTNSIDTGFNLSLFSISSDGLCICFWKEASGSGNRGWGTFQSSPANSESLSVVANASVAKASGTTGRLTEPASGLITITRTGSFQAVYQNTTQQSNISNQFWSTPANLNLFLFAINGVSGVATSPYRLSFFCVAKHFSPDNVSEFSPLVNSLRTAIRN